MRNLTLVTRAYGDRRPKHYKGFGPDCWGLTASYSVNGYAAHMPNERDDQGVISPTAALSSIVYTPDYSLAVMRHLYDMGDKLFGPYGFYDAFSETENWCDSSISCHRSGTYCRHDRELSHRSAMETIYEPSGCTKRIAETGILNR